MRIVDRKVGGLTGDKGLAASTVNAFLVLSTLISLGYVTFYISYDFEPLKQLIIVNTFTALCYVVGIIVVHTGRQLGASTIALSAATLQIVWSSMYLGWQAGLHLYLFAAGQLVFMVFTENQRLMRWLFMIVASGTFLYVQVWLGSDTSIYSLPPRLQTTLFTFNMLLAALILYVLAALAHYRGYVARTQATESAARAEYLAQTDLLTGLTNRRPVMDKLEELSAPSEGNYCVAIADLDHFKQLNDTFGHTCGDRVLASIGDLLRAELRATDVLGRWGGEEFIFVLSDVDIGGAMVMMERVRNIIDEEIIPCSAHSHHVTVSVGVADGINDSMAHRVVKRADDALYEAKADGRNRIVSSPLAEAGVAPATAEIPYKRTDASERRLR